RNGPRLSRRASLGGRAHPTAWPARRNNPLAQSVAAVKPDQPALHPHTIGAKNACFVARIGGLQGDRCALAAQPLQRDFVVVDQGDDNGPVLGSVRALHHDGIAVIDARLDQGVALNFEGEVLAAPEQAGWNIKRAGLVKQSFDRRASRDLAIEGKLDRFAWLAYRRGAGEATEVALNHIRSKTAGYGSLPGRHWHANLFGQPDHLQRSGSMRQPLQEAAFLEPRDKPMDARFRAQPKCLLHLVERRRDAMRLKVAVDEHQQLVLLAR